MSNVLAYLTGCPWAITERMMDTMMTVIDREQDIDAVAARLGRPLENTGNRVERRGSTAVIDIDGPIFRKANLFTQISGATSIELLSRDFQTALDDPNVESILLNVDSPGGEVNGVSELAQQIYEARGRKPIWAYVGGTAASGAYWLASAAERIVMHRSAMAGSIGVIASIVDENARQERLGVRKHEIISSQSPHKRADPATDAGRAKLQGLVDDTAAQFIAEVAQHRGTTDAHVIERYGQGFVLLGPAALAAGMADELNSYEKVIAQLNAAANGSPFAAAFNVQGEENQMAEDTKPQVNEQEVRTAAVQAERMRIHSILNCEEAKGRETLARHLALETAMEPEACKKLLLAAEQQPAKPAEQEDQFAAYMRGITNPKVGVETEGATDDAAQEVARISAYLPPSQRRKP